MSLTPTTPSTGPPPGGDQVWEPGFTRRDAARLGIPRRLYRRLVVWARSVAEHHRRRGTARELWEGDATHNDQFAAPFVERGERQLADHLERRIDLSLDTARDLVEESRAATAAAAHHPMPVTAPESGHVYGGVAAVALVHRNDDRIDRDVAAGKRHHRRVSRWVAAVGRRLPWVEALGLLAFIAYFMDVPIFRPWEDWLGFTLGVSIVAVVVYGQTRLAHEGAEQHNAAREAAADGNRHGAERAYRRRNVFVALAAVAALGVTAGLILRGIAVVAGAGTAVLGLLVFLAVLAGLLMPTISYLAVARDGSTVSRERDSVVADLDDDLDAWHGHVQDCRGALAGIAEIRDTVLLKDLPAICDAVQDAVDEVHTPYNTARLLIGGLAADPPTRTTRTVRHNHDGTVVGAIGTGIPGARSVDLAPLLDRVRRLAELDRAREEIAQRLAAMPPHPWATNRSTL